MKSFQKLFMITLCLAMCAVTGCAKGSSTQQKKDVGDERQNNGEDRCLAGIIKEVRDEEYLISMNFSKCYLVADKCGTDYKEGDSVKVSYAGTVHHNDNNMSKWKEQDGQVVVNEEYRMYIKADEYTGISLWDNDYTFYGAIENGWGEYESDEIWDKEPDEICHNFMPMESEDEGKANKLLGEDAGFVGYDSQINDGEGLPRIASMYNICVKVTYDPETMRVTKVEPVENMQADIQ